MKQIIKYLCCFTLLFTLSFSLVGCTNGNDDKDKNDNTTNQNDTDNQDDSDDFDEIDARVDSKFNDDYSINRSDIVDAANYINSNLGKVKDKEVAKKMYENGAFLERAAATVDAGDDSAIRNLGMRAKNYATRVYNAKDDEIDDIMEDSKKDFDSFKDGVDSAVDDFMDFIEGKKTD